MPYAPTGDRNTWKAVTRVVRKAWWGESASTDPVAPLADSNQYITALNAAGTGVGSLIKLNASDLPEIATGAVLNNPTIAEIGNQFINPPMLKTVTYDVCLNADIGTTPFFIADQAYTVTGVKYAAKTQGTGTLVCNVTKDTGTAAPGAGNSVQTGTFNCVTIVNATVTAGTLTSTAADLLMAAGDRLSVKFTGTVSTLAGVTVTVQLTPVSATDTVAYYMRVNGSISTQTAYIALNDKTITGVYAVYGTAFAGTVTIDITKDTGTTAAGAGTSILAAAMAGDGTINTVLTPALAASAATLSMAAGDRLAVKYSATTTGALVAIVVVFAPTYDRKEVTWQLGPNAQQQVAQNFFIADRAYEVIDAANVFDVTAGGAAKIAVTIDKGTTAAGAGNVVQTDNTSAGFDEAATARTVQYMTPATLHLRQLSAGDRLGLKVTGAAQAISLSCITVSLRPRY